MKKVNLVFLALLLLIAYTFPYSAAAATTQNEKKTTTDTLQIETPEIYTIDVYSDTPNDQNLFEKIGTKEVTALTSVKKLKRLN